MEILSIIKLVFTLTLLMIYVCLIAQESIRKYLSEEIMVVETTEQSNGLEAPAITFCRRGPEEVAGWKEASKQTDLLKTFCKEKKGANEFNKCFEENTFSLKETVFDAFEDTIIRKDIPMNSQNWKVIKGSVLAGQCHTYIHPNRLGADQTKDGLDFALHPLEPYLVFIHDPNFYLFAANPLIFPSIWKEFKTGANDTFLWHFIRVTEHHLYNKKDKPCEESPDYDFQACVKTSMARQIGCRPPWDLWSPSTIPVCDRLEDIIKHEEWDKKIFDSEKRIIMDYSQCLIPCHYKEYEIVGHSPEGSTETNLGNLAKKGYYYFGFNLVSTDIVRKTEVLVYPPVSFISEMGGALGLFVGFSFLGIWDFFIFIKHRFESYYSDEINK